VNPGLEAWDFVFGGGSAPPQAILKYSALKSQVFAGGRMNFYSLAQKIRSFFALVSILKEGSLSKNAWDLHGTVERIHRTMEN
jgi:hypothetical protein